MQDHRAISRARHPRIADPDHIPHPLFHQRRRDRHIAHLRHARIALWPAAFQHQNGILGHRQILPVNIRLHILDILKHMRQTFMLQQFRRCRRWFHNCPIRRKVPFQHPNARRRLHGAVEWPDHIRIPVLRPRCVITDVFPHHRHRLAQPRAQLLQHHRHPPRIGEILHQVCARWHAVHQQGNIRPQLKILQGQFHPYPPRNRQQMHHRIGRPAHRRIRQNRIFKRRARQNLRWPQILVHHLHDPAPRMMRQGHPARIHRGQCCIHRQRHAHGFNQRCHRARRPHRHAHTLGTAHPRLRRHEILQGHIPRPHRLTKLPDIRARPDILALPFAVQHRP